jgi:hypothetical protein
MLLRLELISAGNQVVFETIKREVKMKSLLFILIAVSAAYSTTHAAHVCQARPSLSHGKYILVIHDQQTYTVSVSGLSRNTYEAKYVGEKNVTATSRSIGDGVYKSQILHKIEDNSTWQDMPYILQLDQGLSIQSYNFYTIYGLGRFGLDTVAFAPDNCEPLQSNHP